MPLAVTLATAALLAALGSPPPGDPRAPQLRVATDSALADEPLAITADGLRPGQRVRLTLRQRAASGALSSATVELRADARGRVDLRTAVPLSGSYAIAHGMGLFWSVARDTLADTTGVPRATELARNVAAAIPARLDLLDSTGRVLDARVVTRFRIRPGVCREEVRTDGLVATLYRPAPCDRAGRAPAALVVGGSDGELAATEARAGALASRGVIALAVAYFRQPGLPEHLELVPLEYLERALAHLAATPGVDTTRLGILGESRGAELALLLASRAPALRAVVALSPLHAVWQGPGRMMGDRRAPVVSAWTSGGRPLPHLADTLPPTASDPRHAGWLRALEDTARTREATIPVERINGPVLLVSGGDDRICPCARFGELIVQRLEASRFPHRVRHLSYPDAGHFFYQGWWPARTTFGAFFAGGTTSAVAVASDESWRATLETLGAPLRPASR